MTLRIVETISRFLSRHQAETNLHQAVAPDDMKRAFVRFLVSFVASRRRIVRAARLYHSLPPTSPLRSAPNPPWSRMSFKTSPFDEAKCNSRFPLRSYRTLERAICLGEDVISKHQVRERLSTGPRNVTLLCFFICFPFIFCYFVVNVHNPPKRKTAIRRDSGSGVSFTQR